MCDNDRETDAVAAAWAGVVKPAARALWGYLREHNWPVVMLVWAPVVMLAYCGVVARWPDMGLLDRIYLIVQLLPVQASFEGAGRLPWSLEIARFALPLLTVTTPLVFVFGRWVRLWRIRLIGGHVIVCGAGEKGLALVRSLRARRRAVVVIELDAEGDLLKPCRDAGAVVLVGDATGERVLRRAGAASARRLVAVTPQDDTNVEISNQARAIRARSRRAEPLTCVIQVLDTRFCHDLAGWAFAEGTTGRFELELFNIYRDGAKQLLKDPPPFSEQPAAQHVLVVGTGRMAAAVVERVAWEWLRRERERHGGAGCAAPFWDWLGRRREQGAQCRITLVGPAATAGSSLLLAQHGWVGRCCALVGRDMAVPSAEFEQGAFLPVVEKTSSAYVCLEDGEASFVAGNTLLRLLDGGKVPVTVVVERAFGVAACGTGIRDFPAVFALLDRTCDAGLLERGAVETVARALHDEWRRRPAIPEPPCWEHAPGYMRESSRAAVRSLRDSLAGLGFRLGPLTDLQHADVRFSKAEVEAMARGEHERWFEERDADGWTWARTYDREKRTSPWLRQWDNKDYTEAEKDYDRAAIMLLPQMFAEVEIEVRRDSWTLFGKGLLDDCRQNAGQTAGPPLPTGPDAKGGTAAAWEARARETVEALRGFGYEVVPVPCGEVKEMTLPARDEAEFDVVGGVLRVLDPGFDQLDVPVRQARRAAVFRVPRILARLGFEVQPNRLEILAIALHVSYCRTRLAAGDTPETNPSLVLWRELPRYKRDWNRTAARDIERKLRAVGCHVRERREGEPQFEFEPDEVEPIARMEHERWMEEKLGQGWSYGPVRNDLERTNPYMKPWDELTSPERENDLATARGLPGMLASVGQQIERDQRDIIGRAIHEEYRRSQQDRGQTPEENPSLVPWYRLPPHLQESNRRQADDIVRKLESIGGSIVPATEAAGERFEFAPDEVERLAREEHDRWVRERQADGWKPAPEKDVARKLSPFLVPWEQLTEDIKNYDRDAVRAIPRVLAAAGLAVRRRGGAV